MSETSLSLLEQAGRSPGDGAWRRLVAVYSPLLQGWLGKFEIQAVDADDLVQEVLAVVARDLSKFEHSGRAGAFRTWLRMILVHRVRNFWRSRKYRPTATGGSSWAERLEQLEDESSDASRLWNLEHDRQVMARLLEQIRPRFEAKTWAAFARQVLDGQRADAVADELQMPLNSVYVARSRILAALRLEAAGLIDS